ncbi:hypothetical protein MCAG_01134 [Micromonospora sp. ATCC 39149]|nr:hypothetical protein MCAG_01134 [Micromonospora sp. ATCC 39149]
MRTRRGRAEAQTGRRERPQPPRPGAATGPSHSAPGVTCPARPEFILAWRTPPDRRPDPIRRPGRRFLPAWAGPGPRRHSPSPPPGADVATGAPRTAPERVAGAEAQASPPGTAGPP